MTRNHRLAQVSAILLLVGFFVPGCVALTHIAFDKNLTDDKQRWSASGFVRGGVYETKKDLFLMDVKGYSNGPGLALGTDDEKITRGRFYWGGPTTAALYKKNPGHWPGVMGIVEAGSRIKVVQLREVQSMPISEPRCPYVKGEIVTGMFEGMIVDLLEISSYKVDRKQKKAILLGPNPLVLALVPAN